MLVAAVTIGVGLVCLLYGARSLRVGRAVRRLAGSGPDDSSSPGDATDWLGPVDEGPVEPRETVLERGSIERGVGLLVLGAVCLLFGILAV
ncbi:hypothetical protein GCM10008995_22680 [Halobellus salinus]|uniref:Uncharacterized protein n=1 Tax=Halobellus salinus TaxID=931585 RepID=A0A830EJU8_9EURY|nr:hypothetical protein [Halobellus salinus]GGJ12272.1 hypothetical protein GCM10008995_22680 [Halobellus salinus]SMP29097.1 hypothetical protein SAMN06265347_11462 [Halobellus salinus]